MPTVMSIIPLISMRRGRCAITFSGNTVFHLKNSSNWGWAPVYTAIHAEFLREVRLGETVTITYEVSGLSAQGGRWKVQHDILKSNGKKAVNLKIEGVILDLTTRKPVLPSPELLQLFQLIPRAKDFEVLSETNRRGK